eukprot:CAMPEP_0115873210 /NCGR_PEP_ID=MMETSP0287-20121206/23871_1 /TAXON_ID=412157 /ORGANISM="Chrysochromulina rotalis, Strain UIO044" /LENGTH=76 /DNA_ID=CAMNT_0003328249 /DNA_START=183 /DNA_END=410 /DNA_ORIENTATION=-
MSVGFTAPRPRPTSANPGLELTREPHVMPCGAMPTAISADSHPIQAPAPDKALSALACASALAASLGWKLTAAEYA